MGSPELRVGVGARDVACSDGPSFLAHMVSKNSLNSTIYLWGRSGRGHCRKISADFREISANFPQTFRTLSRRNKT